jgi:hypothetical protein
MVSIHAMSASVAPTGRIPAEAGKFSDERRGKVMRATMAPSVFNLGDHRRRNSNAKRNEKPLSLLRVKKVNP